MFANEKGITWIESVIAASIIFLVVFTFLPLYHFITTERQLLYEKRQLGHELLNELVMIVNDPVKQSDLPYQLDKNSARLSFTKKESRIEGCIEWEEVRRKKWCLYSEVS